MKTYMPYIYIYIRENLFKCKWFKYNEDMSKLRPLIRRLAFPVDNKKSLSLSNIDISITALVLFIQYEVDSQ